MDSATLFSMHERDKCADEHSNVVRGKDARIAQIETALRNLMARLDDHFGGDRANDWKEQEEARVVLTPAVLQRSSEVPK